MNLDYIEIFLSFIITIALVLYYIPKFFTSLTKAWYVKNKYNIR